MRARLLAAVLCGYSAFLLPAFSQEEAPDWNDDLPAQLQELGAVAYRDGWLIRISGTRAFQAGSPNPTRHAQDKLARIARILRRHPELSIRIHGHMDWSEARRYPRILSLTRAKRARALLMRSGAVAGRVSVRGFAADQPIPSADVPAGSALNRRVDLVVARAAPAPSRRAPSPFLYPQARFPPTTERAAEPIFIENAGGPAEPSIRPQEPAHAPTPPSTHEAAAENPQSRAAKAPTQRADLLRLSGFVKSEAAYQPPREAGWTKLRNTLLLTGSGTASEHLSYVANGRFFYDGVYALSHRYPRSVADDLRTDAELRDTYVDWSYDAWDVRVGKQQVVWGEAVGVFIADAVNAKDFREFILPDFDFMRRPHWGATAEWTRENLHLEAVGTPLPQFNLLAPSGYEFAPTTPSFGTTPVRSDEARDPPRTLGNGEIGGRASLLAAGWDMSAFYYYGWDKFPTYFGSLGPGPSIALHPAHVRLPVSGATLTKELRGFVWKMEALYSNGKRMSALDFSSPDGTVKRNTLDYLIGFDRTWMKRVDMNAQFIQRRVFAYGPHPLFQERRERSSVSLWLKTGFWDNRIEPEILTISDVARKDLMIRPKITYSFLGRWQIRAGADFFEGSRDDLFGQYENRDRGSLEVIYRF